MPFMLRGLQALKNPQVQLAIAAPAIGIGATTAIYTVIRPVLLEPLWRDAPQFDDLTFIPMKIR